MRARVDRPAADALIFGALPPPTGGVTVHCDRVRRALIADGVTVEVVNPRARRSRTEGELSTGEALRRIARFRRDTSVAFLQFSGSSSLARTLRIVVLGALLGGRRLVLVQHSGAYPAILRSRGIAGVLHRRLVRSAAAALCLSSEIDDAVADASPRIRRIRAASFVPTDSMRRLKGARSTAHPVLITSGYRTRTYRYHEVIEAHAALRRRAPELELHLYCYGETDDEYWSEITSLVRAMPGVRVFDGIDELTWLGALSKAAVYIRNTSHDSYGVAVAEALFLGVPAVATDVCDRAAGTRTYPVGDVAALVRRAEESLNDGLQTEVETSSALDAYRTALDLFSPTSH